MKLTDKINGCYNFKWEEVFQTDHGTDRNYKSFLALPPARQQIITMNVIAIANRIQVARDVLGFGIPIDSWFRADWLEKAVGGSGANHPLGGAVDPALSGKQLAQFVEFFDSTSGGMGHNAKQAHVDIYEKPEPYRRWSYAG